MKLILKFVSVIFDIDCLLINLAIVCIKQLTHLRHHTICCKKA